jgi:anaerobic magnesium-protoporphyrin IX monomethyl ester cyclase
MKVLLINEPFIKDFCRTQRWAARTRGRVLRAPDWLAYATAVLERDGIKSKLYDFPAMDWGKREFDELIAVQKPDWVILDSTTPSIYSDINYAASVKEISGAKVIMVGPHASSLPEETLKLANGAVDAIAIGEYDYTVRDIINSGNDFSKVEGIAFYDNGGVVFTKPRQFIQNLDELPFPAWHHLDLLKYFDGTKLFPYVDIFSGRGCPYLCTFCLWPQVMHGRRFRFRSAANVVDEIEHDIEICPKVVRGGEFFFEDDTFTVLKNNAIAISDEILRRGLKIKFSVNARADCADLDMFKKMKEAGCRELLVGFESANQKILDNVRKKISKEQSLNFMDLARKAKLDVHGCFVMGLPGETESTMQETIDFAISLGLHTVQFSSAVPFPGTEYFEFCKNAGYIKAKKWDEWLLRGGEQSPVVEYPGLTAELIESYVDKGLKKFYFRPSYMVKFALNTRSMADFYRKIRGFTHFVKYLRS